MERDDWIAACAHQLQRRWRTVDPEQLDEVAADLWSDARLRAMPPVRAAALAGAGGASRPRRHNALMCSHYQAEKRRKQIEKRFDVTLPPDWEPPPGGLHIYPTQMAPFIRRPPGRESGDEAVPDFEVVEGHFGLLPGFAKDVDFGKRTYNARTETVAELASFKNAWAKARHCIVPARRSTSPTGAPARPSPPGSRTPKGRRSVSPACGRPGGTRSASGSSASPC